MQTLFVGRVESLLSFDLECFSSCFSFFLSPFFLMVIDDNLFAAY